MRCPILPSLAVVLMLGCVASAQSTETGRILVDALQYASDHAAQTAWQPMAGTAPVAVTQLDGRAALRMHCNFRGTKIERASWDHTIPLDMSACQALQFRLFCRDSSPVSHFSIYFQSGAGWYSAAFAPSRSDGWDTITIGKEDTRMEGIPGGWSAVRTIRISAWRGRSEDTEFAIGDLALVGVHGDVYIVRGESAARGSPGEVESVCRFARSMAAHLGAVGLGYSVMSDLDLDPQRLAAARLVILPHNPGMPETAAGAIRSYLAGKGKLMAFYAMPSGLSTATGIELGRHVPQQSPGHFASIRLVDPPLAGAPPVVQQRSWNIMEAKVASGRGRTLADWFDRERKPSGYPAIVASDNCVFMTHVLLDDDLAAKRRLLLAMAGQLVPELWVDAAGASVRQIGRFGPYADWAQAKEALSASHNTAVAEALAAAEKLRQKAEDLCAGGQSADAIGAAQQAQGQLVEAYCFAQSPQPDEQRGFWCHSALGPVGMNWDESIRVLAENGFNAIFPNMLWGGLAYYESAVLPVAPEVKERGDQIAQCLAACRKHGVACHVWKVNWNTGGRAPREFVERMKREGRTQVRFDGSPSDTWLCPSHPENRKLETASLVEVASKYDVDGIHFDYIRYPDGDGCFCTGCRERYERSIGRQVGQWPADVRRDPELAGPWLDFRRDNITRTVADVAEAVRRIRPKVKISAAVFSNWPVDRDGVGQDWKLWCERGYLDFVCPMDYTPHNAQFENLVRQQRVWAGRTPCYPGIGLSTWTGSSDPVCRLIEQILITRRLGTGGFTVFDYQAGEAAETVPLCGKGITRPLPPLPALDAARGVGLVAPAAASQPAKGLLRVHPENPRYFTDGTEGPGGSVRAVYLTGSHNWYNLQDAGRTGKPLTKKLDYEDYLGLLERSGHNFVRLWAWEGAARWWQGGVNDEYYEPLPYRRSGPGTAGDGRPRFDLRQFDDAYFKRLRQRVVAARDRGIYVGVMLFQGWSIYNHGYGNPWPLHPFNAANNVNDVDGDADQDGEGKEVHSLQIPAVTRLQEAYIRKVIDTVNDLDNVLYEVTNETANYSKEWQYHVIRYVKEYEAKKPKQHPVGMTCFDGGPQGTLAMLADSPADWISPGDDGGRFDYQDNPPPADGRKVSLADTDHIYGVGGDAVWVWKTFTRGHNPIYMDPLGDQDGFKVSPAQLDGARKAMGLTRRFAGSMNLAAMTPRGELTSTRYCLADPGTEYLIYLPRGGEVTVDLSAVSGKLAVEWIHPTQGTIQAGQPVDGGAGRLLRAPFKGDAALYLKAK